MMKQRTINIALDKQQELVQQLEKRTDIAAQRLLRLIKLPDLCQVPGHPIQLMVEQICSLPRYRDATIITIPEIASTEVIFDFFNFPADHPARSQSDTYYVDETHVLRPHTTTMWYYYLESAGVREQLAQTGRAMAISYGKVYRKDEIDRTHYNVFHNIDCLYLVKKEQEIVSADTLREVLHELTQAVCSDSLPYHIVDDYNPYTDPTLEVEVERNDQELEILGSGVLRPETMALLGLDPEVYNGWAWGPGLERLVMPRMNIPDIRIFWSQDERITSQWGSLDRQYSPISKYPATYRDISFVLPSRTQLNDYYEIIKSVDTNNLVEEVTLLDTYRNEKKFGADRVSYTFRLIYRSFERTLTNEEINVIQAQIRELTVEVLGAVLR